MLTHLCPTVLPDSTPGFTRSMKTRVQWSGLDRYIFPIHSRWHEWCMVMFPWFLGNSICSKPVATKQWIYRGSTTNQTHIYVRPSSQRSSQADRQDSLKSWRQTQCILQVHPVALPQNTEPSFVSPDITPLPTCRLLCPGTMKGIAGRSRRDFPGYYRCKTSSVAEVQDYPGG